MWTLSYLKKEEQKAMSTYWTAFLIVMGVANLAGFGVIAYLKHEHGC